MFRSLVHYMNPFEVLPKWSCSFVKLLLSNAFKICEICPMRKLLPIVICWCILRAFLCWFFFTHIFGRIITMHYIFFSSRPWSSSYFGFINKINYDAVFYRYHWKQKNCARMYNFDRGKIKYLHKIKQFHYIDFITWLYYNSLFIDLTNETS